MIPRLASEYDGNARRAAATDILGRSETDLSGDLLRSGLGPPRNSVRSWAANFTQIWLFVAFPFEFSNPSDQ